MEFYLIILIEAGTGVHTIDFVDYPYRAGSVFTIRKDEVHRFNRNAAVRGVMFLFTEDFLLSYLEKLEGTKSCQLFNDIPAAPLIQLSPRELEEISALAGRTADEYFRQNDK